MSPAQKTSALLTESPGGNISKAKLCSQYGKAPPESSTFFRLQVYEMVGISLIGGYERVKKIISVISVCKRIKKKMHFMDVKETYKLPGLVTR